MRRGGTLTAIHNRDIVDDASFLNLHKGEPLVVFGKSLRTAVAKTNFSNFVGTGAGVSQAWDPVPVIDCDQHLLPGELSANNPGHLLKRA